MLYKTKGSSGFSTDEYPEKATLEQLSITPIGITKFSSGIQMLAAEWNQNVEMESIEEPN